MTMIDHKAFETATALARDACGACRDGRKVAFDFTMAFQPIVDLPAGTVWGYEALVRGPSGESAQSILARVEDDTRYAFDQACRVKAIELAARLLPHDGTRLSINFKPNAVYEPTACIRLTLATARRTGFDPRRLMFELTEDEPMRDIGHVRGIVETYRKLGFMTAIDDFGAGHAGLTLLVELRPDLIKLDMALIRGIDSSATRRISVGAVASMARALDIDCLAEGLETRAEVDAVRALGIDLCQGFYFARPMTGGLPAVNFALG